MSQRIFNADTAKHIDKSVVVAGWVQSIRDHSKVMFIDLRDRTGLLQVVIFKPELIDHVKLASVGREFVVQITGTITKRPDKLINTDLTTGTIELQCEKIDVLSASQTPPFEIENDITTEEEIRLQYRYLDLRRPVMLERFQLRHRINHFIRNWLTDQQFIEVETPMLTKDTPEGAREYMVPSRLHPGQGYALPQSPQQFKQMLMVAGFERYFQIARCMRDEDPRGDRQQEFTQLDVEMSFVSQEEIINLIEHLYTDLTKFAIRSIKFTFSSFARMTYANVLSKYGTDKPDLRLNKNDPNEFAFAFITDIPLFESTKEGGVTSSHHPFTSWEDSVQNNQIMERARIGEKVSNTELLSINANAYDLVLNGYEIAGGSIRISDTIKQQSMFKALGLSNDQIQDRFGHILRAFEFGVPPHGGFASGLDRVAMILADQPNIREVIAFPKTGDGRDLLMGAPSQLSDDKLRELHLAKLEK